MVDELLDEAGIESSDQSDESLQIAIEEYIQNSVFQITGPSILKISIIL